MKEDYPIAGKILEYRVLEKLRSTYTEALPLAVNEETGRIHCSFMQTVTATGRLSCKDPNLQNIPIRSEEGKKFVKLLSQNSQAGFTCQQIIRRLSSGCSLT